MTWNVVAFRFSLFDFRFSSFEFRFSSFDFPNAVLVK